jgi:glutaredoxin 3
METPKLYVKSFCPWCAIARHELKKLGVRFDEINVTDAPAAFEEMIKISGQRRAPTLKVGDKVLADFGPEKLQPFLRSVGLLK